MPYRKIKLDGTPAKATLQKTQYQHRGKQKKVDINTFIGTTNRYLLECEEKGLVPLHKELALLLGIDDTTMSRYAHNPAYANVLKRVKSLEELGWQRYAEKTNKPIFPIFMLKAQHGYIEQQRLDLTSGGQLLGTIQLPRR
jgi:hypothetical protein